MYNSRSSFLCKQSSQSPTKNWRQTIKSLAILHLQMIKRSQMIKTFTGDRCSNQNMEIVPSEDIQQIDII